MRAIGQSFIEPQWGNTLWIVAAVGTGGTITCATRYLRRKNPNIVSIAVEPEESPVISGGSPGPHMIQGVGAGFVPKNLDKTLLNEVQTVSSEEAFYWARRLACEEGLLGGISSGANIAAAIRIGSRPRVSRQDNCHLRLQLR